MKNLLLSVLEVLDFLPSLWKETIMMLGSSIIDQIPNRIYLNVINFLLFCDRYQQLLSDCHQCYFQQRMALLSPSVSGAVTDLARKHIRDHCALVSTGFGTLRLLLGWVDRLYRYGQWMFLMYFKMTLRVCAGFVALLLSLWSVVLHKYWSGR